ncbi:MAG: WYL domain-containing protein [Candidatus Accumulibacter sp.]|nr:WYL domain-containing protein [Accumulibacter sp.]
MLVQQKQLRVSYLSRSKSGYKALTLHPQSLVSRHAVSYLIAMADDYEDLRHFALHRIKQAQILDAPVRTRANHDIDSYIADGAFATPLSGQTVELVADIDPQTIWLPRETPLSDQQSIMPLPEGNVPIALSITIAR